MTGEHPAHFDFGHVEVRDVSRHYGRRRALHKVGFRASGGQLVGLLGPNGAGKSTLLAILATLTRPTAGTVLYGDRTLADAGPAIRARLGVLAHELYLYPELTAQENLEFFARLHRVADLKGTVAAALERAGLADRAGDAVSGFSRGMRQRLALERALLHTPRLVLLDEPFSGLDDASARALRKRLCELRGGDAIIVLSTHEFDVVDGILDSVIVLRDGRVAACERPAGRLQEQYRTLLAGRSPA